MPAIKTRRVGGNISIPDDLRKQLKDLCKSRGWLMSSAAAEAIRLWLKQRRKP